MSIEFTLRWQPQNTALCPCCLETLTNDNIVFRHDTAFCPLCALPGCIGPRLDCLCLLRDAIAQDYRATYRGLSFFTPPTLPRLPLQLVRNGGPDDWLLDPDSDFCFDALPMIEQLRRDPAADTNPLPFATLPSDSPPFVNADDEGDIRTIAIPGPGHLKVDHSEH